MSSSLNWHLRFIEIGKWLSDISIKFKRSMVNDFVCKHGNRFIGRLLVLDVITFFSSSYKVFHYLVYYFAQKEFHLIYAQINTLQFILDNILTYKNVF